jgi:glycosyltransferase involved in cell wall biosynthesis
VNLQLATLVGANRKFVTIELNLIRFLEVTRGLFRERSGMNPKGDAVVGLKNGRVLLICPQPFLINRGTPLSILIILQAITELGYSVDMITTHLGEDRDIDNVEIHRIPPIPFLRKMPPGLSVAKFLIMPFMFICSLSLLLRRKYSFIVSLEDGALYGGIFRRLFGKKHIFKIESLPTDHFAPGSFHHKLMGLYEYLVFSGADVLLPTMAIEEEYVRSKIKSVEKKIVVVEVMPALMIEVVSADRVVELRRQFHLAESDVVVLWIGNLAKYQGAALLRDTVRAMNSAWRANPDDDNIKFLVTGKEEEIKDLFQHDHHENLIVFEPEIWDMANVVSLGDICLSFRNSDVSFPSKVKVFLRAGKAIVAVNTRSHRCHLTHRENSYLIEDDECQAVKTIHALANDEQERKRIGENAKRYFNQKFSWEKYRRDWEIAIGYVDGNRP